VSATQFQGLQLEIPYSGGIVVLATAGSGSSNGGGATLHTMMTERTNLQRRITVRPAFSLVVSMALLLYPRPALSEQYLCVPDKATGFFYNNITKEWDYARFRTDTRYIIAPAKDGENAYAFTKVGEKDREGYCKKDFNDSGFLFCNTLGGEVRFNRVNGRYMMVFSYAYYNVGAPGPIQETDEDSGTPMLQIGKSSPF
jgi:hypothetical protein